MDTYSHNLSASFALREKAEHALLQLIQRGLSREQMKILIAGELVPLNLPTRVKSRAVRDAMLMDGSIGALIGAGLGALIQAALTITDMGLLLAPIKLIGWGAFLGAFLGAMAGVASVSPGTLAGRRSPLTHRKIEAGSTVLLVSTSSAEETTTVLEVLTASGGACTDVDMIQRGHGGWSS
ncbi:hypothetical protein JLK41_13235 [Ectopseudomonas khazarica]|uniref:hypothetical protein n=1 Tax=Ectopseudomonas khazarica TaxID=2502979 RepID=UPI001AEF3BC7|nr:hypothetical protein [Pseudomonas khazarica]QTS84313.1 hypothetical protein JLK41_13235 [Pseudomonas khazarica]